MGFIGFILVFILLIGLFIILAVLGFIRSIFSFGRKKNNSEDQQSSNFQQPTTKSKIFDKKEGEYVDFEEINDK